MDANEVVTTNNSSLSKWAQYNDLIDVHMHLHNLSTDIPTHIRGTQRIGYIFGTPSIIPYISHGGILPYHFISSTDHRSLYIDIELQSYLRCHPPSVNPTTPRKLTTSNPRGTFRYLQTLGNWLQSNALEQQLNDIQHHLFNNPQDPNFPTSQLQLLERQFTTARLKAAQQLKQKSKHPWSPILRKAQHTVTYYKIWLSQFRTSQNMTQQRQRLVLGPMEDPTSHTQAQQFLRRAQKHLRDVILTSQTLRDTHLEDRAQLAQQMGQTSKAQAISNIKRAEKLRQMYRKIRRLTAKGGSKRFTHLIITENDTDVMIHEPHEIFQHLIQRNCSHFGQAEGTPFTRAPLTKLTDIQQIPTDLITNTNNQAVKTILQQLTISSQLPPINTTITAIDLQRLYQIWNENTTTSPSGLHLGHDKCLFQAPDSTEKLSTCQAVYRICLLYTSPSPRDGATSRMPSSA